MGEGRGRVASEGDETGSAEREGVCEVEQDCRVNGSSGGGERGVVCVEVLEGEREGVMQNG